MTIESFLQATGHKDCLNLSPSIGSSSSVDIASDPSSCSCATRPESHKTVGLAKLENESNLSDADETGGGAAGGWVGWLFERERERERENGKII